MSVAVLVLVFYTKVIPVEMPSWEICLRERDKIMATGRVNFAYCINRSVQPQG
jgi:hypothetical protein